MLRTAFAAVFSALVLYASTAKADGPAPVSAWFAPSALKVLRDAKPAAGSESWSLSAARNEAEACQLVLSADHPVPGVRVHVSRFRKGDGTEGPVPTLFKVEYVPNVVGKTPYPDPLPPLGPLDLKPGEAQPVWISVRVPTNARPGDYAAEAVVEAGSVRKSLAVKLHVWGFALPETPTTDTAFGIDPGSIARQHGVAPGSSAAKALYARYYESLLDHRISAYAIPEDLFSEGAEAYLRDPRMTSFQIPYPADDRELQALVARLKRLGCYGKGFFYPIDEPVKKTAYDEVERISHRLQSLAPGYRWVVPFFTAPDWSKDVSAFQLMEGRVNLWCPNSHYFDTEPLTRPTMARRRAQGERVWWYVCCGPGEPYNNFFVQMKAMSHRVLFWQQKREGVQGLLYWSASYWDPSSTEDPWTNMMTVKSINPDIRGDGSLFYPGKKVGVDGPVSSQRLEVIRDGIDDFDYLTLAEKALGKPAADRAIGRIARTLSDYESDPRGLERVRIELGEALEKAIGGGHGTR
ncbi:DUF4091 domain-containing protein [Aquisphaera insulae]|uniref:DUF4091 domain-containing protein n=1 Tax=Aquisphaera insulae TaxID=2712864 RepID=UPI0013EC4F3C|nr:DUF4091 domain-containing protein [Aquisphaera insulae]